MLFRSSGIETPDTSASKAIKLSDTQRHVKIGKHLEVFALDMRIRWRLYKHDAPFCAARQRLRQSVALANFSTARALDCPRGTTKFLMVHCVPF